jgi:cell division septation protein DedD
MKEEQLKLFKMKGDDEKQKRNTISLPIDTLVLLSVVLILAIALIYSFGIQRGKSQYASANISPKNEVPAAVVKETVVPIQSNDSADDNDPKQLETTAKQATSPIISEAQENKILNPQKPAPKSAVKKQGESDNSKYAIQVASYNKKEEAMREVKILKQKGYSVNLAQKGKFVVIFVGGFNDKTQAKENMSRLQKQYKDCFIRRL